MRYCVQNSVAFLEGLEQSCRTILQMVLVTLCVQLIAGAADGRIELMMGG